MNPVRELKKIAAELAEMEADASVEKEAGGESMVTDLTRALELIGENAKALQAKLPAGEVTDMLAMADKAIGIPEADEILKRLQA